MNRGPKMEPSIIGEKILQYRIDAGISMNQFSKLAGIEQSVMSLYESGKRKNMTVDTLLKLSKAMDMPACELLGQDCSSLEHC